MQINPEKQTIVDSKFEDITATVFDSFESETDKETDDEVEGYEPEVRPEHETEHDSNCLLIIFMIFGHLEKQEMKMKWKLETKTGN